MERKARKKKIAEQGRIYKDLARTALASRRKFRNMSELPLEIFLTVAFDTKGRLR
ncbi:MAG: hypothetical protein ACRD99_02470 [Nitrososphaera sp.]